jgi:predicted nucleotidyltransferase
MPRTLDERVIKPGDTISFADRDDLLEGLDRLNLRLPGGRERRHRTTSQREHFCMLRYLRFLAGEDLLPLPVTLRKAPEGQDPPDFTLEWPDGRVETFELTDGSTRRYQKTLSLASDGSLPLPVDDINTPVQVAAERWADILFAAFLKKARGLVHGRFDIDHLLIYDMTGLGLFTPVEVGAPLLRQKIDQWHQREQPRHSFSRISVLKDWSLLLDITGSGRMVKAESPYFRLGVLRALDEEDLSRRLREIDRYCRDHRIRHLKLFGSILGDRNDDEVDEEFERVFCPESAHLSGAAREGRSDRSSARTFRDDSDLDLLVEFEPGTRVTLLDMAHMERELSDLIGFTVDLRTAEDLSRYFRQEVLDQAVELSSPRA